MSPIKSIILLTFLGTAARPANPPRHYAYSGNDARQWTSTVLPATEAAAAADFTVFPCNAPICGVGQVITDADRNIYVVGSRYFSVQGGSSTTMVSDVFVAKLDPTGATLFIATFSGKGSESGSAIALDSGGNIYAGGSTGSLNFPLRNAVQAELGRGRTGFLMKLSPDGSQLIYSTYFGGSGSSSVNSIVADSAGNLYVTGQTGSRDFPVTPGMPAGRVTGPGPGEITAAFVAKLNASGDILYSGRISGNAVSCGCCSSCFLNTRVIYGEAIGLDSAGNAYIAGNANVTDLPTTQGVLVPRGIGAWVARVNAGGTGLDYLTYLGVARDVVYPYGSPSSEVSDLAVDGAGNAYIIGKTTDPKFPATPGALQSTFNGPSDTPAYLRLPPSDAFVAKLNPQGTAMIYATFLGGSGVDAATRIALDSSGTAYVTGTTNSLDFPVTTGTSKGEEFIAVLNPEGSALSFSSRYRRGTFSSRMAVDADGRVWMGSSGGIVSSLNLMTSSPPRLIGITSAAAEGLGAAAAPGELVSLMGSGLGPTEGTAAAADSNGRMPTALAGTQVFFDNVAAPLLYASEDQINAVTPFALIPGKRTTVRIVAGSAASYDLGAVVVSSRPAIFASRAGAAVNEDGTVNSEKNPAKPRAIVTIWVTGVGAVFPVPMDGQLATKALSYFCCDVHVFDNRYAEVLYSGSAPGMVAGVVQINFRVPADLPIRSTQAVPVRVTVHSPGVSLAAPSTASIYVTP